MLSKFLNLSHAKVKEEIFVCPQIRKVRFDEDFGRKIKSIELAARKSIKLFFLGFVGNQKEEHYPDITQSLQLNYDASHHRKSTSYSYIPAYFLRTLEPFVMYRLDSFIRIYLRWSNGVRESGIRL